MTDQQSSSALAVRQRRLPNLAPRILWSNALLGKLFARIATGRLTVVMPSGASLSSVSKQPGPEAVLVLHRWRTLRRLMIGGDVAFGEAYMDGDWSSPDIVALIALAAANEEALRRSISGFVPARLLNRLRHLRRANTRRGSRRNIVAHYDLGNAFYERWLDRGMSYSSGIYQRGDESLEEAQTAKQDRVIAALDLRGGERVLEIGCGWGGLAERLGRLGCKVTAITLSPAQLAFASARIDDAGLSATVEVRHQDYRSVTGTFDRIVSVEMIEAVGQAFWPTYFATLRDLLESGGRAVLQAITIADDRFASYVAAPDFIQRYVFPGGMLPSPAILARFSAECGFDVTEERFGNSYARTLREWHRRFLEAWSDIAASGFDERFRRLWTYYLAYCEAGFVTGAIDVGIYKLDLSALSRSTGLEATSRILPQALLPA